MAKHETVVPSETAVPGAGIQATNYSTEILIDGPSIGGNNCPRSCFSVVVCFLDLEDAYGRNDHSVSELVSGYC